MLETRTVVTETRTVSIVGAAMAVARSAHGQLVGNRHPGADPCRLRHSSSRSSRIGEHDTAFSQFFDQSRNIVSYVIEVYADDSHLVRY